MKSVSKQRSRWAIGFAVAVAVTLIIALSSGAQIDRRKAAGEKNKEWAALQVRVKDLGQKAGSADWQQLIQDIDAWATKYGVKTTMQSTSSAATSGGKIPKQPKRCLPNFQHSPNIHCVLDTKQSTARKCVYKCYQIQ